MVFESAEEGMNAGDCRRGLFELENGSLLEFYKLKYLILTYKTNL